MAEERRELDEREVERRKRELLARARGEKGNWSPNAMMGIGLQFTIVLLLFLFGGQWLDRRLGTSPWFLLIGMVVGAGIGFWTLIRAARDQ